MSIKQTIARVVVLAIGIIAAFGCASTPEVPEEVREIENNIESIYTVVDHKGSQLGINVPNWTYRPIFELERDENFSNQFLYRFERIGADLDGLRLFTDNFDASSQISQEVAQRVRSSFEGFQEGDTSETNLYFESVVSTISETNVSGFRKYDDYWIQRINNNTEEVEFVYYTLFMIEKNTLNSLIQGALNSNPPTTAAEGTVRDRLIEIVDRGF